MSTRVAARFAAETPEGWPAELANTPVVGHRPGGAAAQSAASGQPRTGDMPIAPDNQNQDQPRRGGMWRFRSGHAAPIGLAAIIGGAVTIDLPLLWSCYFYPVGAPNGGQP